MNVQYYRPTIYISFRSVVCFTLGDTVWSVLLKIYKSFLWNCKRYFKSIEYKFILVSSGNIIISEVASTATCLLLVQDKAVYHNIQDE